MTVHRIFEDGNVYGNKLKIDKAVTSRTSIYIVRLNDLSTIDVTKLHKKAHYLVDQVVTQQVSQTT